MVQNLREVSFKELPAVICTAGSYIARVTPAVGENASKYCEGRLLYDSMEPVDVLSFDARFASREKFSVFSFPIAYSGGYRYATAVFDTILGRRFAIVFLEKVREEKDSSVRAVLLSLCPEDREGFILSFAKSILAIPEVLFEKGEIMGLTDIKSVTKAAIENLLWLQRFSDFEITLSENEEMKSTAYMPADIPLSAFLQMAVQLLFAAGEISFERKARVKLCKYNMSSELRVTVDTRRAVSFFDIDSVCRVFPRTFPYLSACSYVAGIYKSVLSVVPSDDISTLTLVLSLDEREIDEVDFKSRDPLLYFVEDMAFVLRYTLLLGSGNTEE